MCEHLKRENITRIFPSTYFKNLFDDTYLLTDVLGGLGLSYGDVRGGLCLGCNCSEGSLFFPLITLVLPFALPYVGLFLTSTGMELLLLLRLGSALQKTGVMRFDSA